VPRSPIEGTVIGHHGWLGSARPTSRREPPWVWGPAVVHDQCRYDVRTPLDDRTGYRPVGQRVRASGPSLSRRAAERPA